MKRKSLLSRRYAIVLILAAVAIPLGTQVFAASPLPPVAVRLLSTARFLFSPSVFIAPAIAVSPGVVMPGAMAR